MPALFVIVAILCGIVIGILGTLAFYPASIILPGDPDRKAAYRDLIDRCTDSTSSGCDPAFGGRDNLIEIRRMLRLMAGEEGIVFRPGDLKEDPLEETYNNEDPV